MSKMKGKREMKEFEYIGVMASVVAYLLACHPVPTNPGDNKLDFSENKRIIKPCQKRKEKEK